MKIPDAPEGMDSINIADVLVPGCGGIWMTMFAGGALILGVLSYSRWLRDRADVDATEGLQRVSEAKA